MNAAVTTQYFISESALSSYKLYIYHISYITYTGLLQWTTISWFRLCRFSISIRYWQFIYQQRFKLLTILLIRWNMLKFQHSGNFCFIQCFFLIQHTDKNPYIYIYRCCKINFGNYVLDDDKHTIDYQYSLLSIILIAIIVSTFILLYMEEYFIFVV